MSLEQISQKLKNAREGQGLSVRQIYERTKIPVGHLQSIENGVFDELPEPVYVAGFIKRYGDCVGLSGQTLSEEYRRLAEETGGNGKNGWAKHSIQQPVYISADLGRIKVDRDPPTFKTIYFNAIWIVVVLALISYLTYTQLNNQASQQDPSVLALKEAASRYNNSQPATTTGQNSSTAPTPTAGDAKVGLSASQHVWTEVNGLSNGASLFTGYLEQGDRRDFQDPQGLRVRVGNGGSLTVDFQGRIETFGEPGKVAERTFMSQSATTATTAVSKDATTAATSVARPATVARRTVARPTEPGAASRRSRYRSIDEVQSRQYLPGESLGGTRSIDVPYRYSEGRLDAD